MKVWVQKHKKALAVAVVVVLVLALLVSLVVMGPLRFNTPSRAQYPVWGVDVSEYQGSIDWDAFARQDVRFAFVKASEGSGYTDPTFAANYKGAQQAGIPVAPYHFFSFESPGKTQAENFIKSAPQADNSLPPVVDVELYSEFRWNTPPAAEVRAELDATLREVEAYYGEKPILYTTAQAYRLYLNEGYGEYPLWMREVYFWPSLPQGQNWLFWQYSDKGRLEGYNGQEKYIDLNVFAGDEAQWQAFLNENE